MAMVKREYYMKYYINSFILMFVQNFDFCSQFYVSSQFLFLVKIVRSDKCFDFVVNFDVWSKFLVKIEIFELI